MPRRPEHPVELIEGLRAAFVATAVGLASGHMASGHPYSSTDVLARESTSIRAQNRPSQTQAVTRPPRRRPQRHSGEARNGPAMKVCRRAQYDFIVERYSHKRACAVAAHAGPTGALGSPCRGRARRVRNDQENNGSLGAFQELGVNPRLIVSWAATNMVNIVSDRRARGWKTCRSQNLGFRC